MEGSRGVRVPVGSGQGCPQHEAGKHQGTGEEAVSTGQGPQSEASEGEHSCHTLRIRHSAQAGPMQLVGVHYHIGPQLSGV